MKEFVEKLIGRLDKYTFSINTEELYYDKVVGMYELLKIVNQLAEEYNNGWIPCSERMPEKRQLILATLEYKGERRVETLLYYDSEFFEHVIRGFNFLAWMPQPEPYKEV